MGPVATFGSVSSHGGVIDTCDFTVTADGIGVATFGSMHVCPIPGHGTTPIISTSLVTVNGLPIARAYEDFALCGAVIVSGVETVIAA